MHILILTEPVSWWRMLKSQQMHDIYFFWTSGVGGNAKINLHDILILTDSGGWWEC
jgi:hypothetical protein